MLRVSLSMAVLTACVALARAADDPVDYQKAAEGASWDWHADRADVLYAVMNAPKEYTVEIVRPKNTFGDLTLHFKKDDKELFTLAGHAATTFVIDGGVLYYANYHRSSDGCALIAFDLMAQKELWKTNLQGLGPIDHFEYTNAVTVEAVLDAILVHGNESAGRYIEYVDRKTGKTVVHKVFK